MPRVFLSHSARDKEVTAGLHTWLTDKGHHPFLDSDAQDGIPAWRLDRFAPVSHGNTAPELIGAGSASLRAFLIERGETERARQMGEGL